MIIFDCNGVLVDSEPIATAVAAEAFQRVGISMTPEMVARYFTGRRPSDMFAEVENASGRTAAAEIRVSRFRPPRWSGCSEEVRADSACRSMR